MMTTERTSSAADATGTLVVVNPSAGSGQASQRFEAVRKRLRVLLGPARIEYTDCEGHAVRIARSAVQSGVRRVVSAGGDGTHREVINGIMAAEATDGSSLDDIVLSLLPLGSGNDLMRSVGIPGSVEDALPLIKAGQATRTVDVASCTCATSSGRQMQRYFVNVADVGIGGPCVEKAARYKPLGGTLAYLAGAVHSFVATPAEQLRIRIDGDDLGVFTSRGVIIANGRYFGGGMHVAPQADLDDGLLDVIVLGDLSALQFVYNLPKLYRGTYHDHEQVTVLRGRRIEIESADDYPVPLQIDGEVEGHLPAVFEMTPHRLTISANGPDEQSPNQRDSTAPTDAVPASYYDTPAAHGDSATPYYDTPSAMNDSMAPARAPDNSPLAPRRRQSPR